MELYIRIQDGAPFEHPILGDNFRQAFPDIDTNNLPPEFASFTRVDPPILGVYELYDTEYQLQEDGSYMDVHSTRDMSDAEKTAKQDEVKANWEVNGFDSWTFNEDTCEFDPPEPYPDDDKLYRWDEDSVSWVEVPA
jgi:hypothetical protein|tara:strand:+ start:1508 stop:1918 length:411 start_codon:yes stop_codon:yes gene_type:complete